MNEFTLNELIDKLESVFLNILYLKPEERMVTPAISHLTDIKNILNEIFKDNSCTEVMYTLNTDKQFFGVHIDPTMTASDALTILATDEKIKFNKYRVELDSKLFDLELSGSEIIAILLHEISSMVDSYEVVDKVRALIDLYLLSEDDVIYIRDSANYSQLIIYALKDTFYKVSSAMFKDEPEELVSNKLIITAELEDSLLSAQQKILSSSYGVGDSVRTPKTIILRWMFMIYKDMKHNSNIVKDTLLDAKDFTASRLEKFEIDKTLTAVERIGTETIFENAKLDKVFESKALHSLNELSLFKSLKTSGLRSIEDSLYEYALRIKNCDTEEDAMYILRSINTRLSILEDYIYNTPDLSETERKHWETVAMKYRELREQLAKKKIVNKKQYGLFFDYDQLDYLDKNSEE